MYLKLKNYFSYLKIITQLFKANFKGLQPYLFDQFINGIFYTIFTMVIFQFLLAKSNGLSNYGTFILICAGTSWGFYSAMEKVTILAGDISGNNSIKYELTLPIPQNCIFIKIALTTAAHSFYIASLLLLFGKIFYWKYIDFSQISFLKYYFMLSVSCIFYGFFLLTILCIIDNLYKLNNLWMRILLPLTHLGGAFSTWKIMRSVSPWLAYINLLNPLTYAYDGIRSTALPAEDFIPYWCCIAALLFFSCFFGALGTKLLKRKLDCI